MKGSLLPLRPAFKVAGLSDVVETLQSEGERSCNKTFVSFLHSEEFYFFFMILLTQVPSLLSL